MAFILKTILLLASITSLVTADVPVSFVVDHGLIDSSFALNPNTSLVKRETAYQQALRKGRDLWKELNGPQDQTPNRWATIAQLQANGWRRTEPVYQDIARQDMEDYARTGGPLSSLGLDQLTVVTGQQDLTFANCYGTNIQATYAIFRQAYDARGAKDPINDELIRLAPDLVYWSDVTWILWVEQCRQAQVSPGSLRTVFKHTITTGLTQRVMERIKDVGEDAYHDPWPGTTKYPGVGAVGNHFKALLGTPHGRGVVRLLTNHLHDAMAGKTVESIQMFTTSHGGASDDSDKEKSGSKGSDVSWNTYHLLFTLTD